MSISWQPRLHIVLPAGRFEPPVNTSALYRCYDDAEFGVLQREVGKLNDVSVIIQRRPPGGYRWVGGFDPVNGVTEPDLPLDRQVLGEPPWTHRIFSNSASLATLLDSRFLDLDDVWIGGPPWWRTGIFHELDLGGYVPRRFVHRDRLMRTPIERAASLAATLKRWGERTRPSELERLELEQATHDGAIPGRRA